MIDASPATPGEPELRLALLPAAHVAALDWRLKPRLALIDAGLSRPEDSAKVLATTLAVFTGNGGWSAAALRDALTVARYVHS